VRVDGTDDARIERVGDSIVIEAPRKRTFGFNFSKSVNVRIACPPGHHLEVRSASTDVACRVRLASANVQTASGDVRLCDVDGDVQLKTASGTLRTGTVKGELDAHGVSGDMRFERALGDVRVVVVSGDINLEEIVEGLIQVRAVSGDLTVLARPGTRLAIDASTVSGKTRSDLPVSNEPVSGPGPMAELRLSTTSGDIHIGRAQQAAAH
jgi:DUF4097 and DUF4098 domain-containing protein YvlB